MKTQKQSWRQTFVRVHEGGFTFHIRKECDAASLLKVVKQEINGSLGAYDSCSKHARNRKAVLAQRDAEQTVYLKRFFPPRFSHSIKDTFRSSKAVKAWKAAMMLSRYKFRTAPVLLVGERRSLGRLLDSVLVTEEVPVPSVLQFTRARFGEALNSEKCTYKRELVRALGREIGRMHSLGIVHGDLLPGNILVDDTGHKVDFVFLDNDRTRKLFRTFSAKLLVHNLVQLGRFPLPGITLSDRLRFFKAYIEANAKFKDQERELANWIAKRIRERLIKRRLKNKEGTAEVSLRALLSWTQHA